MPQTPTAAGVYARPPADLVDIPADAIAFSPLEPGAASLETRPPASLDDMVVLAPPGTVERRAILALSLRALKPGATLTALAPKDKGGLRLARELAEFGCDVGETARKHHRICQTLRPEILTGLDAAIEDGALRFDEALGAWTQAGVFSHDRLDAGSALLCDHLPVLSGRGADLGCGIGTLALNALKGPRVARLALIDIDRRAIAAARRNVTDERVEFHWADARQAPAGLTGLDFVVMNPPFHVGGIEDRALGQAFIARAAAILRPGGVLWMTANRHLPYEGVLGQSFKRVQLKAEANGFKIFEAQK